MRRFAPWMIAAAGVLWGLLGIFVRHLNARGLASMDLVFLRSLTATVVLFIGLLIFDRKKMRVRLRDFWCFLGTGIGSIVFFNYCYFTAVRMMSLAAAAVLLYTAPALRAADICGLCMCDGACGQRYKRGRHSCRARRRLRLCLVHDFRALRDREGI